MPYTVSILRLSPRESDYSARRLAGMAIAFAVFLAYSSPASAADCVDKASSCSSWTNAGYCTEKYVAYMTNNCPKSCGFCADQGTLDELTTVVVTTATATTTEEAENCVDKAGTCPQWTNAGYCDETSQYASYMASNCRKACGLCEDAGTTTKMVATTTVTKAMTVSTAITSTTKTVATTTVSTTTTAATVTTTTKDSSECVDEHVDCGYWAVTGDCDNTKYINYMSWICRRACGLCATAAPLPDPPKITPAPAVTKTATPPVTPERRVKSVLSCDSLGWNHRYSNDEVCGESDSGLAGCSGAVQFNKAQEFCHAGHARLCTAIELSDNAARGTGCELDEVLVWTSTECTTADGRDAHWATPGSSKPSFDDPQCLLHTSAVRVRCCADAVAGVGLVFTEVSVDNTMPGNYGDMLGGESEFRMPPVIPPSAVPTSDEGDYGKESLVEQSNDGSRTENESGSSFKMVAVDEGRERANVLTVVIPSVGALLAIVVAVLVLASTRSHCATSKKYPELRDPESRSNRQLSLDVHALHRESNISACEESPAVEPSEEVTLAHVPRFSEC